MPRPSLALALVVLGAASCAKAPPPGPAQPVVLTYYYLKFCTFCEGVKRTVEDLPAQYGEDRLVVRTIEHLEPGAPEAIKALGFKSHGLVMQVGEDTVFRQADHKVDLVQARLALDRLLGGAPRAAVATRPP